MSRTIFVRGNEWAYWVVKCKVRLTNKPIEWRWKIVGAQMRVGITKTSKEEGWTSVLTPESYTFDANNAHFPGMPTFVFNKKKEAEGWLKLLCDHYYIEE